MATTPSASAVNKTAHEFERAALDGLLIKRFFFCPAFEIYGGECPLLTFLRAHELISCCASTGVKGLYDYVSSPGIAERSEWT